MKLVLKLFVDVVKNNTFTPQCVNIFSQSAVGLDSLIELDQGLVQSILENTDLLLHSFGILKGSLDTTMLGHILANLEDPFLCVHSGFSKVPVGLGLRFHFHLELFLLLRELCDFLPSNSALHLRGGGGPSFIQFSLHFAILARELFNGRTLLPNYALRILAVSALVIFQHTELSLQLSYLLLNWLAIFLCLLLQHC